MGELGRDASRPAFAAALDLAPHPEGGWYRQTWRSAVSIAPDGYPGTRASATAIYFVLGPGEESSWHRVLSAELWLWHAGSPLRLRLAGDGERPSDQPGELTLGADVHAGQRPQAVVPAGTWQSARPVGDGEVLVTCVVSPGFDFADFEQA